MLLILFFLLVSAWLILSIKNRNLIFATMLLMHELHESKILKNILQKMSKFRKNVQEKLAFPRKCWSLLKGGGSLEKSQKVMLFKMSKILYRFYLKLKSSNYLKSKKSPNKILSLSGLKKFSKNLSRPYSRHSCTITGPLFFLLVELFRLHKNVFLRVEFCVEYESGIHFASVPWYRHLYQDIRHFYQDTQWWIFFQFFTFSVF